MQQKGFTLIELLVVVLIIGILSAFALPQYQKAVDKARFAEVMSNTRVLKNAAELFYLSSGSYPQCDNVWELDMDVLNHCTRPVNDNVFYCEHSWYDMNEDHIIGYNGPRNLSASIAAPRNAYKVVYDHAPGRKYHQCIAWDGSARAHALCASLGGVRVQQSTVYEMP